MAFGIFRHSVGLSYKRWDKNTVRLVVRTQRLSVSNLPPWLSVPLRILLALRQKTKEDFAMTQVVSCLTVYFDDPFWAALYERWENGQYEVCRVVFGAEPKDYQVYDWLQRHWRGLQFSPALPGCPRSSMVNPKRMQREIQKQLQHRGPSTKAQLAIQQQREEQKETRRKNRKMQKENEEEKRFLLRQKKRKQKHKGR